ncbi:hypothetical protein F5884DRAFT_370942 [Xylogone sp. PMI_703]|nr:hypothetical protein F5884DRAFT_370942 [Xylogone sp. PMI_703]
MFAEAPRSPARSMHWALGLASWWLYLGINAHSWRLKSSFPFFISGGFYQSKHLASPLKGSFYLETDGDCGLFGCAGILLLCVGHYIPRLTQPGEPGFPLVGGSASRSHHSNPRELAIIVES